MEIQGVYIPKISWKSEGSLKLSREIQGVLIEVFMEIQRASKKVHGNPRAIYSQDFGGNPKGL